jgi:hypothetical protein
VEVLILAWLAGAALMAMLGAWVAVQKGREPVEGGTLGFLFGPFGVLIEALLPTTDDDDDGEDEPAEPVPGPGRSTRLPPR